MPYAVCIADYSNNIPNEAIVYIPNEGFAAKSCLNYALIANKNYQNSYFLCWVTHGDVWLQNIVSRVSVIADEHLDGNFTVHSFLLSGQCGHVCACVGVGVHRIRKWPRHSAE